MTEQDNITVIQFEKKIVKLKIISFDTDVDTDDILKIDYSNILGEILTFPVIMNRLGLLRAEMEEIVSGQKLDLDIYEAQLAERYRKTLTKEETKSLKGGDQTTYKKPTKDEVDNAVLMDEGFHLKKKNYFRTQRNLAYIESLYWSAKSKDDKLNKLSDKLRPEEFENEIIDGLINGILIKVSNKAIK